MIPMDRELSLNMTFENDARISAFLKFSDLRARISIQR